MMRTSLPRNPSRAYTLLKELLNGPGTMYQLCERAGIDLDDTDVAHRVRLLFAELLGGHATVDRITYTITERARAQFALDAKEAYVGQVALPRPLPAPRPVTVVRRAAGGAQA